MCRQVSCEIWELLLCMMVGLNLPSPQKLHRESKVTVTSLKGQFAFNGSCCSSLQTNCSVKAWSLSLQLLGPAEVFCSGCWSEHMFHHLAFLVLTLQILPENREAWPIFVPAELQLNNSEVNSRECGGPGPISVLSTQMQEHKQFCNHCQNSHELQTPSREFLVN